MIVINSNVRNFFKSLKLYVFLMIVIIGVVPVTVFKFVYVSNYEDRLIDQRLDRIKSLSLILKNNMIKEGYMDSHASVAVDTEIFQITSTYNGRIMVIDPSFKIIKDTYAIDTEKICMSESVIRCFYGQNIIKYSEEKAYIEIATALASSSDSQQGSTIDGVVLMTFSLEDIQAEAAELDYVFGIVLLMIYLMVILIAVLCAMKLAKPFKTFEESIDNIKLGQFKGKFKVGGYSEMTKISKAVEQMMKRMKTLDDSRQEFVSNVSHELKTPMTSIKVLADSLLMQEDVPIEMYKEFMTDIVAEIDRENQIISDLLTLVKLEKKTESLNIEPKNINELVELILKRLRPIAAQRNIELVFESFRPVIAEIDEVKMTIVISNLVENAVKYNILDGWVRVSLNADHKFFYLKVSDSGVGIPEESQSQVFERFYRVDKTRSRETGGTGLGLSITYNTILLHKGDIKLHSKEGEGTTFIVRIPLTYVP